ncbi:hypothetical protein MST22_18570 [Virgibacillus halodenitrificans]|uniref:hypothetical protein n=1 Tax=Virgibacillus halodenitrificans TaxID=1482 RepID=UPI001FB33A83|nr:hypothetical protein [Virgibacillus halodenitrificans]MCJ0933161.1 hypothetical protein [Virgibacillus halodenitrificans]
MKPSYSNLDSFLEDLKNELICNSFSTQLELLKNYRQEQRTDTITLDFDNYTLELPGTNEVVEAMRCLEHAIEKTKNN